jgi:hypothetical protein
VIELTKKDAAARLGISVRTLERRVRAGDIEIVYGARTIFGKRSVRVRLDVPAPCSAVAEHPQATESDSPEVTAEPEPKPQPLSYDPCEFRDSWGNTLTEPCERFLALFARDPGSTFDAPNPALTLLHIRQVAPRESFHTGGSRRRWPGAQNGYGNAVDSEEFTKLWQER